MAWQLIYTSAPRGLALGQSGFCTVARHAALRERLVAEIERFSGYAHLYPPSPDGRDGNPVISCHRILTISGARYHVLSKIRAAGFDYTRRTNHIAHHLICQSQEVANAVSPAQMLRAWGGWLTRWQGEPRYFEEQEQVSLRDAGQALPLPGKNWEGVTRDARFAALLLDPVFQNGCHIVGPPQSEDLILKLYEESLRLLDPANEQPSRLWQIPFTTFLQSTDNPEDFIWRGCRKDRPLPSSATAARTVDITNPARLALPANAYVEVARTGARQDAQAQNSRLSAGSARPRGPIAVGTPTSSARQGRINVATPAMTQPVRRFDNKLLLVIGGVVSILLLAIIALLMVVVFRQSKAPAPEPSVTAQQPLPSVVPGAPPPAAVQPPAPAMPETAPAPQPPPSSTTPRTTPGAPGQLAAVAPAPGSAGPTAAQPPAVQPKKMGKGHPGKAAQPPSPSVPPQPPVYLVTEQQDINPVLKHYFGDAFGADKIPGSINPCVKKFRSDQWPCLETSETSTEFINQAFLDKETKPVVRLREPIARQWRLETVAGNRDVDWQLHFQVAGSPSDGLWVRRGPFVLCLVRGDTLSPLFTYGIDGLELTNQSIRIAPGVTQQLARLRPLGGTVKFSTLLKNAKPWWSDKSVLSVAGVEALDYSKLAIEFRDFEKNNATWLAERLKEKAALEKQSQDVSGARKLILTQSPFVDAGEHLFKKAKISTERKKRVVQFDSYWDTSPMHSSGKQLADWDDYADYLKDIWVELLDMLYNTHAQPSEALDIRKMLQEVADHNMAGLHRLPERIEGKFGAKFRHRTVEIQIPNPRQGQRGEPDNLIVRRDRFELFAEEWKRIFSDANAAKLVPLRAKSSQQQKIQQQRMIELALQIEQLKRGKEAVPTSLDQLHMVNLEWETPQKQRVILALFGKKP